ncbi:MAG: Sec-dependent nitrous-oxide reductase [Archangium sp.]|nr:Sec-dependent nitrous-oxide reductase [Archangium sp.]MDP3151319.1 Sec-dependent nitrous-oxide reductase [Archangium sp.]MDP3571624.1 Sec-dependent nitrous-oxide reductase [Archangium sp.]
MKSKLIGSLAALLTLAAFAYGCQSGSSTTGSTATTQSSAGLKQIMVERKLSEADVEAALLTYKPTGQKDEYVIFASGGQSGQILVIGVPSMRLLKVIAVFTPEPWQGYGYGGYGDKVLAGGQQYEIGQRLTWADVHHPNLSETKGDYDGRFLFVNDKANARIAVVDLSDFATKQIVPNKLVASDHGGAFVTPDNEYVIETSQYPAPLGREYAPISEYKTRYRGLAMFWKFDKVKGRIIESESWGVELPPYTQDLADCGKLASDGYVFINSFNTEMATGGILEGNPPVESGASQNDTDFLHVINWKKAEALVKAGKAKEIKGVKVLMMDVSGPEKVLTLIPEHKSPHGADVTPDGEDIVVGGKLDTHATVYSFKKIQALIEAGTHEGVDPYGLPILPFKDTIRGQVEIGLGPLHTVYDGKGFAYTSVFIESVVAKWDLKSLKVVDKLSVHYNIGHILAAEGDTVSPDGKYVVAMNKMSIDRFANIGPLYPQNFQLVGIENSKMKLLADMPIGIGEPHYAQMIKADKLKPMKVYPMGTNPLTDEKDEFAVTPGKERIERKGNVVDIYMTAIRSHFTPDYVEVDEGDTVRLHLTSIEQAEDQVHGFTIDMYNINVSLEPGKHENITFVADKPGAFPMYCTEFCSALHLEMMGYFMVKPKK